MKLFSLRKDQIENISRDTKDGVLNCLEELILKKQNNGTIHYIELTKIILQLRTIKFLDINDDGEIRCKIGLEAFKDG